MRWIRKLIKRLNCRRHRWRPNRRKTNWEFCDLCGAQRRVPAAD